MIVSYLLLVRVMAHGHIGHVLLGAGNGSQPIGAASIAIIFLVVRFLLMVVVPGALLVSTLRLGQAISEGGPRR